MFQLDPAFTSTAMDEFVADIKSPNATRGPATSPALTVPVVANENHSTYIGPGNLAWEDDEHFYVFED